MRLKERFDLIRRKVDNYRSTTHNCHKALERITHIDSFADFRAAVDEFNLEIAYTDSTNLRPNVRNLEDGVLAWTSRGYESRRNDCKLWVPSEKRSDDKCIDGEIFLHFNEFDFFCYSDQGGRLWTGLYVPVKNAESRPGRSMNGLLYYLD